MFEFFKKDKPATVAMVGQPVHLNLDPISNKMMIRNLTRMLRLIEHQKKTHLAPAQIAEANAEFVRKQQVMIAHNIMVPSDKAGIEKLIVEIQAQETSQ